MKPHERAREIGERLREMDEQAPIDLRSLCDRLDDVFDEDGDTPDEVSQLARKAIESLWAERDARQLALQGLQAEVERLKEGLSISTRSVMAENDKLLAEVERVKEDMNRPRTLEEISEWWAKIDEAASKAPEVRAADGVIQASVRAALHIRQERDNLQQQLAEIQAESLRRAQTIVEDQRAAMQGLADALGETREAAAACFRVISKLDGGVEAIEKELKNSRVKKGFGVRAAAALDAAKPFLGAGTARVARDASPRE